MGAISQNFSPVNATIKAFQAGDDIALMPVKVSSPADAAKVTDLVKAIVDAVNAGTISEDEINQSVLRILKLKLKLGLIIPDATPLAEKISRAEKLITDPSQRELENSVSDAAITLVQNNHLIPVKAISKMRIHILTPWLEQGAGIAEEIKLLQTNNRLPKDLQITFINMAATDLETEKKAIDNADLVMVGDSTKESLPLNALTSYQIKIIPQDSLAFPEIPKGDTDIKFEKATLDNPTLSDAQFAYQALQYAKNKSKPTIFISLLAPYDLPNYKDVAVAMLAGYDNYGYYSDNTHSYFRGPSMQALTRVIFGIKHPSGKLPIDIPDPAAPQKIVYSRGFGLSF
jgi:beta-N-acetylhexosaminidase